MLIQILLYSPPSLPSQPYCVGIGDVANMLLATTPIPLATHGASGRMQYIITSAENGGS